MHVALLLPLKMITVQEQKTAKLPHWRVLHYQHLIIFIILFLIREVTYLKSPDPNITWTILFLPLLTFPRKARTNLNFQM